MRLSPALLAALLACGPMPPGMSPAVQSEPPVEPSTPPAVQPLPQAPRAAVSGGGAITGARIANADRAIAGLRKRMRSCYQQALNQHPGEVGTYSFTLLVDAQGSVTSAEGVGDGSLSPETLACFSAVINSTRFAAPEGPSATVRGQMRFYTAASP